MKKENKLSWRLTKIDASKNEEYQAIYNEICGEPIPTLSDNLEMQVRIEQLAINYYLLGYKKAQREYQPQISQLCFQRKVLNERLRGLEKMLEDKNENSK